MEKNFIDLDKYNESEERKVLLEQGFVETIETTDTYIDFLMERTNNDKKDTVHMVCYIDGYTKSSTVHHIDEPLVGSYNYIEMIYNNRNYKERDRNSGISH